MSINTDGPDGLNVELNVVPFIDLLSSLVLFLLLSAVWMQVSSIQASTETKGRAVASPPPIETKRVSVHVSASGVRLSATTGSQFVSLARGGNPAQLKAAGERFVKQKFSKAAVTADGGVEYGLVVLAIDTIKDAGFQSVALAAD